MSEPTIEHLAAELHAAADELHAARQHLVRTAEDLATHLDRVDLPISIEGAMDLSSRARGILADVGAGEGDKGTSYALQISDVDQIERAADELVAVARLLLERHTAAVGQAA